MARSHGKAVRLLVNERHASADITGWAASHQRAYADVSNPTEDWQLSIPGRVTGSLTLNGLFDATAGSLWDEADDGLAAADNAFLTTVMPEGLTAGGVALITLSDVESVNVPADITDAVKLEIGAKPDIGVDIGVILHALAARTADTDGSSVDNGASSAGGGVASLHVTAYSGLTDAVVKVQHSTDNSVWSDLVTFTTVTAATYELKTVTGTVNRYLRYSVDVTGTGSVTFGVAFARR